MKLKSLSMNHFRGATQLFTLPFDENKNLTMIFGENGSGKSTIVDAFSFLCEQSIGSLEDRSSVDKGCIVSINGDKHTVSVKLVTDTGNWQASFKPTGASIQVAPVANVPNVRILRRAQILRLIDQEPGKRYEALSKYIEIPGVSKSEETLRKATKTCQDEFDQVVRDLETSERNLSNLWQLEGKPGSSGEDWAAQEALSDISTIQIQKEEAESIISNIDILKQTQSTWHERQEQLTKAAQEVDNVTALLKAEESANASQGRSLIELLKSAKQFIDEQSVLKNCPVCNQSITKEALSAALLGRIKSMEKIADLSKQLSEAEAAKQTAQTLWTESSGTLAKQMRLCAAQLKKSILTIVQESLPATNILEDLTTRNQQDSTCIDHYTDFWNSVSTIKNKLDTAKDVWSRTINQHNAIVTYYKSILKNRKQSHEAEKLVQHAQNTLEIVESLRKEFVQAELNSIAGEVDRLYAELHPAEKIGGVKLSLSREHQRSLYLTANFYTKSNITPQSLYSESHLDTLGFVVFFALAKKYQADKSIIVLDDIITSVDEYHLDRFIKLLHNEAHNFAHVLITTHYRPWCDRYKQHRAPGGELHFMQLREWTVETGIRISTTKAMLTELRDAINAADFNRREVSNIAGIFLENVLDWLTIKYGCRLPRKTGNSYTLKELADAVAQKTLVGLLRVKRKINDVNNMSDGENNWIEIVLRDKVETIKELSAVRNQVGCHFNFDGSLVSDKDVKSFAQAALELGELLCCPQSGDFPDRDKSGEYWETKSQLVQLYPLRIPVNA